jgi:hypothetical protein
VQEVGLFLLPTPTTAMCLPPFFFDGCWRIKASVVADVHRIISVPVASVRSNGLPIDDCDSVLASQHQLPHRNLRDAGWGSVRLVGGKRRSLRQFLELADDGFPAGDGVKILGHLIGGPVPASWQAIPPK